MNRARRDFLAGVASLSALSLAPVVALADPKAESAKDHKPLSLFDGKSLTGWKSIDFGGQGEVKVEDGRIVIATGENLSGIVTTRERELPRMNYEISFEAMRLDGGDFFCGLTFPVNKDACSFIAGGWGGAVVGLSSLDGLDASENDTSTSMGFESNRWYAIRTRVLPSRIQCWIDKEKVIDVDTTDRRIGVRIEVDVCTPLGFATWQTSAALRKIQVVRV